jgi:Winged helix-turn-helix DNA-binding
MDREELTVLRDALTAVLAWPEPVLEQVARWLAPEPAKPGNGLDHDPPPIASAAAASRRREVSPPESSPRRAPPSVVQARRGKAAKAQAGERKLLAAMQANPGASANALAKAAAMSRSTAADHLRRLGQRRTIEKDAEGRWRVRGEEPRPTEASPS